MPVTRAASRFVVAGLLATAVPAPLLAQASPPAATAAPAAESYYQFLMARRLESQGDQAGALAALQRAAAADPRSAMIRAEIAGFEYRHNRRDEAEKAANEALTLDAENADAHRVLGLIFAARAENTSRSQAADTASNVRQAITHLEKATTTTAAASDINLFYTLGRLYLRSGDEEKAVQALMRVVALNPDSVQGRLTLAQAYVSAGNTDGAIQTLEEIAADEPRVAATLGQYLEQAGRPADAARAYTTALGVAPMNRELKFRRAAALFTAGQYADAATAAAEAQAQHPDDLRFPRIRARALAESGAAARALEVLEPSARANPGDAATQFALADIYNDAGRAGDAERTLRQLVMLEPMNADALNYLGYLLADRGQQLDEAVRLVQRALAIEPDNPSFLDSLGWAYFQQGKVEDAEKALAPAAAQLPKNSVIQLHIGDVLARRGKLQEAIAAWTRALAGDGEDIDKAAIQQKIDQARARAR
jgi:tetratricopeptide (TPR) repeat protein